MQLTGAPTGREWAELARRFEAGGYDTISLPDHLGPQFAAVPALAAVAMVTERVRLSMFVLANDFRNPAVLAKEITTLDVLSGGRVEVGLGAGWHAGEYAAQGVPFDRPGVRIARLAEAVTILKRAFAGGPVHFSGEHYRVEGLDVLPRPVRADGIPIVLGGGGPRMLALAAREADVVGIATDNRARDREVGANPGLSYQSVQQQVGWVREAAGARLDEIELNIRVLGVRVARSRAEGAAAVAAELGVPPEILLDSPFVLVGSVDEIHEWMLRQRDELGISYYTVSQRHADQLVPLVARIAES
jgi:probable F420-dependent oxidoreductase